VDTPVSIIEQIAERIRRTRRIRSTVCPFVLIRICTTMYMHCRTFLHVGASYLYCHSLFGWVHNGRNDKMSQCYLPVAVQFTILSWMFTLFSYSSFLLRDYPCVDHMIDITSSPFYFPYHSDIPPYLCLSHSHLILLLSRIISLIVLCFYFSSYPHSLLSIWLSLYLLHSVLLFYILLSSYRTFYSTYLLALFLIVIPTKFQVFLTFLLVDSST